MDATSSACPDEATLDRRIDKMLDRDRVGASAFVAALWVTILFVLFSVWPFVTNQPIRVILMVAGGLVLTLNTAAIFAMLSHYKNDKHFIYGLDLKHLDEMRKRRG